MFLCKLASYVVSPCCSTCMPRAAGANVDLMCCEFSPDGKWLACGDSSGTITVLQTDTYQVAYRLHDPLFSRLPVTAVRFRGGEDKETANTLLAACEQVGGVGGGVGGCSCCHD